VPDENDYTLLGCDASQLELRVLAHYMKDKKYIHQILHGDIHTTNQQMAGLETRDQAKTFIYALIYGAGAAKIGYIMNKSAKHGQATKNKFLQNVPALNGLLESVHSAAERTGKVRGLDGRYFHVRSLHSSLNVLIQGGGAIICKEWLIQIMKEIITEKIDAKPVANIHDEIQFEVRKENAEKLGEITKTCMKRVEKILGLDCPLDSEYKIGTTWAMTH
jgi:DNA polymerase I-like protein with 3'-5' exonuclease and polymerase domains